MPPSETVDENLLRSHVKRMHVAEWYVRVVIHGELPSEHRISSGYIRHCMATHILDEGLARGGGPGSAPAQFRYVTARHHEDHHASVSGVASKLRP